MLKQIQSLCVFLYVVGVRQVSIMHGTNTNKQFQQPRMILSGSHGHKGITRHHARKNIASTHVIYLQYLCIGRLMSLGHHFSRCRTYGGTLAMDCLPCLLYGTRRRLYKTHTVIQIESHTSRLVACVLSLTGKGVVEGIKEDWSV